MFCKRNLELSYFKPLILILPVLYCSIGFTQINLGVKLGTNLNKVDGISFESGYRFGYHLGGWVGVKLHNKFSVLGEVLFSQSEGSISSDYANIYSGIINSNQEKVKFNYLSIPLLIDYKLVKPIHLQLGGQFSSLLNQSKSFLENGEDAFKKGEFSIITGARIEIKKVNLTGRYIIGISNINHIDKQDKWKNQIIQFSIEYKLF